MQLTRVIFRIALVSAIASAAVTAQNKPSAQKKPEVGTKASSRAAQVTYTGGQLSVVANNNSLADTLAEIRELTKAKIEGVQPTASDRISGEFGPDTPRAVLGALLASSHYNFILVSPPGNPGSLQRIVLSEPAPEPHAAVQPTVPPGSQPSAEIKSTTAEEQRSDSLSKENASKEEADRADSPAAEKEKSNTENEGPEKESKPETTNSGAGDPNHETAGNQPNVPPTVEICGVTYTAAQLADLRVPDHCSKPTQQPNSTNGSKQSN